MIRKDFAALRFLLKSHINKTSLFKTSLCSWKMRPTGPLTIVLRIQWLFKPLFKEYNILIYAAVFQSARTKENDAPHSAASWSANYQFS